MVKWRVCALSGSVHHVITFVRSGGNLRICNDGYLSSEYRVQIHTYPDIFSFLVLPFVCSLHTMRPILLQGHVSAEIELTEYGV